MRKGEFTLPLQTNSSSFLFLKGGQNLRFTEKHCWRISYLEICNRLIW